MEKKDLKAGDVVVLMHNRSIEYTYLRESTASEEDGIFAYNPAPTFELRTVTLPYAALVKNSIKSDAQR